MSPTKDYRKQKDMILALASVMVLILLVSILFDYYYEFNDDVLMKDILSGAYTGSPSSRNIQMLFPISAIISLLYRIVPGAPVYGLFLCACQYGCAWVLTYRSIRISPNIRGRIIAISSSLCFFLAVILPHIVMVQYTITVAILAATAAFVFYTIPDGLNAKDFYIQAAPAVIIVILAFWIRSEMLLLCFPFIGIVGLIRWDREHDSFQKSILIRYSMVILCILIGLGASLGIDKLATSSTEWKTFISEFNNRTQLYDYQYVPDYDENSGFYLQLGLEKADVDLLSNYNYALDRKINGEILGQVAEYAKKLRQESTLYKIKYSIKEYIYRLTHFTDGIYAVITLFLYVVWIWAVLARKESSLSHKLHILGLRICGLFIMRSIPWIYIIMGRRAPNRIVHSLYIMEIVILLACVLVEFTSKLMDKDYLQMITSVVLIGGGIISVPIMITQVKEQVRKQESINKYAYMINDYCKSNPENFYFEDVYSTIRDGETFNQKMFVNVDNTLLNYDLMGGWASNSPLYREKLSRYDISLIDEDLVTKDNIYVICDLNRDIDWIENYYESQGRKVEVSLVDEIDSVFGVYSVNE